jgi:hypothetical protein
MKSIRPVNVRKERRYMRNSYMEEGGVDASIISEDLPLLKEGEVSFPHQDKKFTYVYGIKNFIDVLKGMGEVNIVKPSGAAYKDVNQLIILNTGEKTLTFKEMRQQQLLYLRDGEGDQGIIDSHPFRRYVTAVDNASLKKGKKSFLSIFKDYEKQLCVHCLMRRTDELVNSESKKIHDGKKLDYVR